ncbi:hypothetical protein V6N13_043151 [Hibiscus sabdariffa]|uniref:Uncharacterized protein n=1 Tax=Hibiscus sabdariffa TaxID=183260 RepID=A0ABR2G2P7_9ROSI
MENLNNTEFSPPYENTSDHPLENVPQITVLLGVRTSNMKNVGRKEQQIDTMDMDSKNTEDVFVEVIFKGNSLASTTPKLVGEDIGKSDALYVWCRKSNIC